MEKIHLSKKDIAYLINECKNRIMIKENIGNSIFYYTYSHEFFNDMLEDKLDLTRCVGGEKSIENEEEYYSLHVSEGKESFHGEEYGFLMNVRVSLDMNKIKQDYDVIPLNEGLGNGEWKIISTDRVIPNISRYILRIDMCCVGEPYRSSYMRGFASKNLLDKIFYYSREKDFLEQNDKFIKCDATINGKFSKRNKITFYN